jgi:hypothetical protein
LFNRHPWSNTEKRARSHRLNGARARFIHCLAGSLAQRTGQLAARSAGDERQQGNVPCALYCDRNRALVSSAGSKFSSRLNLASLREMPSKPGDVLIVDFVDLIDAKRADFSARHESSTATTAATSWTIAPFAVTAATGPESSAAFAAFGSSRPGQLIKSLIVISHLITHLLTNAPLERHIVHVCI